MGADLAARSGISVEQATAFPSGVPENCQVQISSGKQRNPRLTQDYPIPTAPYWDLHEMEDKRRSSVLAPRCLNTCVAFDEIPC